MGAVWKKRCVRGQSESEVCVGAALIPEPIRSNQICGSFFIPQPVRQAPPPTAKIGETIPNPAPRMANYLN